MQAQRIVLKLAIAIGGLMALQSAASSHEYRGTMEQQMACTPDVFRFCGDADPGRRTGSSLACGKTRRSSERLPRGIRIQ